MTGSGICISCPSSPEQAYDDDFYIKVKNLTVHFKLTQVDRSPDDWGNGGTQEDEL